METPINIIENQLIELRRIVKYKGELCEAKICMFLADIIDIEGSRTKEDDKACTKIMTDRGIFKVRESYNRVKETWIYWIKSNREALNEE